MPEIGPKRFGAFEKRTPGLKMGIDLGFTSKVGIGLRSGLEIGIDLGFRSEKWSRFRVRSNN